MFLSWVAPRSVTAKIEPRLHLPIGGVGKTDRSGLGDAFEPAAIFTPSPIRSPPALLDDVAEVDAYAELDALIGRYSGVALDHRVLNCDGAAHGFDHAAELDQRPVAGALEHLPVRPATVGSMSSARSDLSRASVRAWSALATPTEADDIGGQNRRNLSVLAHPCPPIQANSTRR